MTRMTCGEEGGIGARVIRDWGWGPRGRGGGRGGAWWAGAMGHWSDVTCEGQGDEGGMIKDRE